jgi:hypothetical protein
MDLTTSSDFVVLSTPVPCWHESRLSARVDSIVALSPSQALIATDRPLPAGTQLYLELDTASGKAGIDAVSVSADGAGFTIEFVAVDADAGAVLDDAHRAALEQERGPFETGSEGQAASASSGPQNPETTSVDSGLLPLTKTPTSPFRALSDMDVEFAPRDPQEPWAASSAPPVLRPAPVATAPPELPRTRSGSRLSVRDESGTDSWSVIEHNPRSLRPSDPDALAALDGVAALLAGAPSAPQSKRSAPTPSAAPKPQASAPVGAAAPGSSASAASPQAVSSSASSPQAVSPSAASPQAVSSSAASPQAVSSSAASPQAVSSSASSPQAVSSSASSPQAVSSSAASPSGSLQGVWYDDDEPDTLVGPPDAFDLSFTEPAVRLPDLLQPALVSATDEIRPPDAAPVPRSSSSRTSLLDDPGFDVEFTGRFAAAFATAPPPLFDTAPASSSSGFFGPEDDEGVDVEFSATVAQPALTPAAAPEPSVVEVDFSEFADVFGIAFESSAPREREGGAARSASEPSPKAPLDEDEAALKNATVAREALVIPAGAADVSLPPVGAATLLPMFSPFDATAWVVSEPPRLVRLPPFSASGPHASSSPPEKWQMLGPGVAPQFATFPSVPTSVVAVSPHRPESRGFLVDQDNSTSGEDS